MFTVEQIREAHAKVKSGEDFPAYVQELIHLGVKKYNTYLTDGHNEYFGENDSMISSENKYAPFNTAAECDKAKFQHCLKIHQQGETDYPAFCQQAAEAGIYKWTVDFQKLTCIYFDKAGNEILSEKILVI